MKHGYFATIRIPEYVNEQHAQILENYESLLKENHWIPTADNFLNSKDSAHVTLRYLGPLTQGQADRFWELVQTEIMMGQTKPKKIGPLYLGTEEKTEPSYLTGENTLHALVWKIEELRHKGRAQRLRDAIDHAFEQVVEESLGTENEIVVGHVFPLNMHTTIALPERNVKVEEVPGIELSEGGIWMATEWQLVKSVTDPSRYYEVCKTGSLI